MIFWWHQLSVQVMTRIWRSVNQEQVGYLHVNKTWPFDQAAVIAAASSSVCTCKPHRLKENSQNGLQVWSQADSRSDL